MFSQINVLHIIVEPVIRLMLKDSIEQKPILVFLALFLNGLALSL